MGNQTFLLSKQRNTTTSPKAGQKKKKCMCQAVKTVVNTSIKEDWRVQTNPNYNIKQVKGQAMNRLAGSEIIITQRNNKPKPRVKTRTRAWYIK